MHGVVVPRPSEGCEPSEESDGFRRADGIKTEVSARELGDDGEASTGHNSTFPSFILPVERTQEDDSRVKIEAINIRLRQVTGSQRLINRVIHGPAALEVPPCPN